MTASGAKSATLSYDPLGRLLQTSGGVAGVTQFLYDGDRLVAEYDGAGNLKRRYVHGAGIDEPLLWYEGADLATRRGLLADHQGSIIAVATPTGERLVSHFCCAAALEFGRALPCVFGAARRGA